jgi:EAL domain-containing protein (putative c-di-GMP-specific phosphodiesterase class I)
MLKGLPGILNCTEMHFIAQPILHRDGELFGHELLLRFKQYPDPQALLKIVKHLDLRHALDMQVCEMATTLTAVKQDAGCWLLNLYAESLPKADLQLALEALAESLQPTTLWLHVLELDQTQDMPHLRNAMRRLHEASINFALDVGDLQHPYSQFLPFDLLRMNVNEIQHSGWSLWLEEARMRGIPLLAYRVENEAQVHALSQQRIDFLQGYAVRDVMTLELPHYTI